MNIRPVGFLDVSAMTATFLTKRRGLALDQDDGTKVMHLRRPVSNGLPDEYQDGAALQEWKAAKSALTKIEVMCAPLFGGKTAVMAGAFIEILPHNISLPWAVSRETYWDRHFRLHVCMVPSPGAWLYSGGEGMVPPVGQVTMVNQKVTNCAINVGPCARIHLVVDVRAADE